MHSAVIRDGDYTVVDLQQAAEGKVRDELHLIHPSSNSFLSHLAFCS